MRSSNPSLTEDTFKKSARLQGGLLRHSMTMQGTVTKTAILLVLLFASALYTWNQYLVSDDIGAVILAALIAGLFIGILTIFVPKLSPFTAPIYAVLQGLALGAVSAMYEAEFNGIVVQAVLLTMTTLLVMLFLYKTRIIKATENFRLGVVSATGAIAVVYLIDIGMRLFGFEMPFIHETGTIGILISLFIVAIAALNLVLDFDFIEQGVAYRAPKYMEWYAAFGLMVTIIWLYLEILRLLSKLQKK